MTEKVFYDSTHTALFRCPECSKEKTENVTAHILSSVEPTITCTCECGHVYSAVLEWKDESEAASKDDPIEMASDEAVSASAPSHEPLPMEDTSDTPEMEGPLTLEGIGLAMITCPNCQKEQPDATECAFCGIVLSKYQSSPKPSDQTALAGAMSRD